MAQTAAIQAHPASWCAPARLAQRPPPVSAQSRSLQLPLSEQGVAGRGRGPGR
jgi:hypothetical protein